jgi:NADP-dependent 3-hydroxy acid dehydrogenase YdfG
MKGLQDKVALVTGGSSGIGQRSPFGWVERAPMSRSTT